MGVLPVETLDVVQQFSRIHVETDDKQVRNRKTQYVEWTVEVALVVVEERVVEALKVEYKEIYRQVPRHEVKYIEKKVGKHVSERVEKVVVVPHFIYEERTVEAPQVHNVKSIAQARRYPYGRRQSGS